VGFKGAAVFVAGVNDVKGVPLLGTLCCGKHPVELEVIAWAEEKTVAILRAQTGVLKVQF
jgi:hypothetical protein